MSQNCVCDITIFRERAFVGSSVDIAAVLNGRGDTLRESLGRFLVENEQELRRIARRKLGPATRTVFDSGDVASSVIRKIDELANRGELRAKSEAEFWGLVRTIIEFTAIRKVRLVETARRHLAEDGPYSALMLARVERSNEDDAALLVLRMAQTISNSSDRQMFLLRLQGVPHKAAAALLKTTEDAVKSRWHRVRSELQTRFEQGEFDG